MNNMNITTAKYILGRDGNNNVIKATIDGETVFVSLDTANRHYAEIKAKHDDPDDSFTIQDAD